MTADVHTLSGAYALDALSPEEAAEFRRHLAGCQACRDEVRELRNAAALMGAAEAEPPPAHLKSRVLAAADRTPQQPPRVGTPPATGSPTLDLPVPDRDGGAGDEPAGVPSLGERRARRSWTTWLAAAAAAVVVVGGAAVGIQAVQDDPADPALSAAATQVFEAEDARTATVETANGGRLTVGVSPSRNEMAVDTRDLPALEEGQVYQLWAVHDDEMVSAGILTDIDDGAAMGMPGEDTTVAVTVEPAPGSETPTGDPIVQVDPRAL